MRFLVVYLGTTLDDFFALDDWCLYDDCRITLLPVATMSDRGLWRAEVGGELISDRSYVFEADKPEGSIPHPALNI